MIFGQEAAESGKDGGKKKGKNATGDSGGRAEVRCLNVLKLCRLIQISRHNFNLDVQYLSHCMLTHQSCSSSMIKHSCLSL